MNADKMTKEEFDRFFYDYITEPSVEKRQPLRVAFWSRIQAIQSAPFAPDWKNCPQGAVGFRGSWVGPWSCENAPGEFYIPAPSNPSDAELSAMWEKLDRDKRVQILRDAGVVV